MTKTQYRALLAALKMSQGNMARLLGISRRASQGYALGDYPIPQPTAILLGLLSEGRIAVADIERYAKRKRK